MKQEKVHKGSGNIYKDLGFRHAEEMQAKAALITRMMEIIKKKKWTQEEAALVLKVPQPKISLLSRGQFSGFSLGKLIHFLNLLNQDVEIVIKSKSSSRKESVGHVSVHYA